MAHVPHTRRQKARRHYKVSREMKLGMALGRLALGSALGFALWIVGSYVYLMIAMRSARLTGSMALLDAQWPFNLVAFCAFVTVSGLAGLAAGDAPFRKLAGRWRYYL